MSAHVEKDNYFSFIKSIANHLEDGDLTINKILCLSIYFLKKKNFTVIFRFTHAKSVKRRVSKGRITCIEF